MTKMDIYENGELKEYWEVDRESAPNFVKFYAFGKVLSDTVHLEEFVQALSVDGRVVCVFQAYFQDGVCLFRRYTNIFNHMTDSEFLDYQKFWRCVF